MRKPLTVQSPFDQQTLLAQLTQSLCACVGSGAKPLELTPPMSPARFREHAPLLRELITRSGLHCYREDNADLMGSQQLCWYVIYREEQAFKEYYILRLSGKNPAVDYDSFRRVFSLSPRQGGWDGDRPEQSFHSLFCSW